MVTFFNSVCNPKIFHLYNTHLIYSHLHKHQVTIPSSLPYSQKHKEIAVKDDSEWNEENKTAQHHRVAPVGQRVCDIIPCTRCHQALWDIGA